MKHVSLVLALVFVAGSSASAQEPAGEAWRWRVAPYLWTTAIDGTLTTPLAEVDVDFDFGDIWDNLESAGLVNVQASRGSLALLADFIYLGLDADGETTGGADADVDLDTTIVQLASLYRLTPTSPVELGGGLRYAEFDTDLEVGMGSRSRSRDAFDGFAAGRATWPLGSRWSATLYGDVGAGDSDLTWQASAMLGLRFEGWGLGFGYRILDYDFEEGSDELDLAFEGLVYGVEFRF